MSWLGLAPRMSLHNLPNPSILVVGCGSIGTRHIRNLRSLGLESTAVCDSDPEQLSSAVSEFGVAGYDNLEKALDSVSPEVVLVCTPPYLHIRQAMAAVLRGAHIFVEKPLSHSLEGIQELLDESSGRKRIVQVGYNFRFHPGLQKVKSLLEEGAIGRVLWARAECGQYLPDWRPERDYRRSYTGSRSEGGGIILDGSHEIDYMRWLLGEAVQVYCLADTLSDLQVDTEDTASMVLRFASGCLGEIHLDFVQRKRIRSCKIVGTEGTIRWDHLEGSVSISSSEDNDWQRLEIPCDPNEMYLAEMEAFLRCLDGTQPPAVDVDSATRVMEIALAAHRSAASQCAVTLPYREESSG